MRVGTILSITTLTAALSLPLLADDLEQVLLTVQPSFIECGCGGRFDTRLVVYNAGEKSVRGSCVDDICGTIAPGGHEIGGPKTLASSPTFLFLPKESVARLRMSLITQTHRWDRPDDIAFAELPIVRVSDFRDTTISIVGVRMQPGFRQGLRIYALDGTAYSAVDVRVYDLATDAQIYEEVHWLMPLTDQRMPSGEALAPAFNMECDLSRELPQMLDGRNVRIEIEPLTEGMKIWAFVSITNNDTQHFSSVVPR
jgi:hypothetical protein